MFPPDNTDTKSSPLEELVCLVEARLMSDLCALSNYYRSELAADATVLRSDPPQGESITPPELLRCSVMALVTLVGDRFCPIELSAALVEAWGGEEELGRAALVPLNKTPRSGASGVN